MQFSTMRLWHTPPLHCALNFTGNIDVGSYLLDSGAEVDQCDTRQQTPLLYAAARGHLPVSISSIQ